MPKIDLFGPIYEDRRRLVTLTVTEDCNLRCRYCYEPNKIPRYMSCETAQNAIVHFMETEKEFEGIEFDFFGGEPMLAFDLIRDVVDWFHSKEWPKKHLFFICTNGTILNDETKSWLVENKECVKVGISLDGNRIAHNLNRSNSYDLVRSNLPFFMEHWPTQLVKMTISAETIPYVADSIIELEEMEVPFSANIVFEDIWGTPEQKEALLEIYAQQLDRLVKYYVDHPDLYPARIVDVKVEMASQELRDKQQLERPFKRWCGAGHEMVVVEVDGSHSPCHRFSPWITKLPLPEHVNRQASWQPEECSQCKLVSVCPVCAGFNWEKNGDSGIRTTYHCDAFKLEAQASAKLQALRLLQKTPAEIAANLSKDEVYQLKCRIDSILEFASEGI